MEFLQDRCLAVADTASPLARIRSVRGRPGVKSAICVNAFCLTQALLNGQTQSLDVIERCKVENISLH